MLNVYKFKYMNFINHILAGVRGPPLRLYCSEMMHDYSNLPLNFVTWIPSTSKTPK